MYKIIPKDILRQVMNKGFWSTSVEFWMDEDDDDDEDWVIIG